MFKGHVFNVLLVLLCCVVTDLPVLLRAFESTCLLCCHRSIIMHRYVPSVCFLACLSSPGLSGKDRLGGIKRPGAQCSKQWIAWPGPARNPVFQWHQEMRIIMRAAACISTRTQFPPLFVALGHNTVQPRLSFRHRACYGVIALLINVSPSQDNGLVFTVRFSRLAMRNIQWCNLLSVHYALHGSPWGTLFPGSSQVTYLLMHNFSLLPICFSLWHRDWPKPQMIHCYIKTTKCDLRLALQLFPACSDLAQ